MSSAKGKAPSNISVKARSGRPQAFDEQERRRRIVNAAESIFTAIGYGAATVEKIAKTAGMSKKTIYSLYPDKAALFAAFVSAAPDFPWENENDQPQYSDLRLELRRRLIAVIDFVLSSRQVRITRLLIAEAENSPLLADEFFQRVVLKTQSYLASVVFELARARGHSEEDLKALSNAISGAAIGQFHLFALMGRANQYSPAVVASQVDLALELLDRVVAR